MDNVSDELSFFTVITPNKTPHVNKLQKLCYEQQSHGYLPPILQDNNDITSMVCWFKCVQFALGTFQKLCLMQATEHTVAHAAEEMGT